MKSLSKIETVPEAGEAPLAFAERLGLAYAESVDGPTKKQRGQFFTPSAIAKYMSEMPRLQEGITHLRILDPGCGVGILSVAMVVSVVEMYPLITEIRVDLFETDRNVGPLAIKAMNYVRDWASSRGVDVQYQLRKDDFILYHKDIFDLPILFGNKTFQCDYDIVIANPPYFKIGKDDPRAVVGREIVYGQPNIYSLFMTVAARLLKPDGRFVFIVPRGFTAGQYFRRFRQLFLDRISIRQIHLFASRTASFKKDKVLQELLIIYGQNGQSRRDIVVSTSQGMADLDKAEKTIHPYRSIVDLSHQERLIFLPTDVTDTETLSIFRQWTGSLEKYGIQISTGPVVSFRSRELLFREWQNHTVQLVPLFQLINTGKMTFLWPVKKKDKPQYINQDGDGKKLLLPNKNYVFLRRFSAKDDASRLVASPYFALKEVEWIGVENHLNYIYRPGSELTKAEVIGLSALLNSDLFDRYFRTFNGNINVSATELRNMPLPPMADILRLGSLLIEKGFVDNLTEINNIVNGKYTLQTQLQYE